MTIVDFSAVTLLRRAIHEDALAKVCSVLQSCFVLSIGIGAALAPILVAWIGIRGALLATGGVLPVLVVLLWSRLSPLDTSELQSDEIVNVFRSLLIFAPLELPVLEGLARAATIVNVEAGQTVITEGSTATGTTRSGTAASMSRSTGRPSLSSAPAKDSAGSRCFATSRGRRP